MVSGRTAEGKGGIYFEADGEGMPVVLIHAGYLDSRMWDREFHKYSKKFRVIRYDIRGYGRSSRATAEFSDAEDLKSVLDELKIRKTVIVGVSNGGRIALDFAVKYPEHVIGLVLVNSGVSGYKASEEDQKLFEQFNEIEEKYVRMLEEHNFREAAVTDVDFWTHMVRGELRERLIEIAAENVHTDENEPGLLQKSPEPPAFESLNRLDFPVLVIVGEKDNPASRSISGKLHEMIPGSQIKVIPGSDHIPSLSSPEEFDSAVFAFAAGCQKVQ